MLYYTSRNPAGQIDATYSGRFAFIHFRRKEDYEAVIALRNDNDMKGLWSIGHGEAACNAVRILAHEYTHKHIFALSDTGLVLNSIRFWVRLRFLAFGSQQCVEKYYRMRTFYFMETKPYHESLASAIDEELESGEMEIEKAFRQSVKRHRETTIGAAESVIRDKWRSRGLLPTGIWAGFHRVYGKWLQENFAVKLSCRDDQGNWFHGSFADRGITNDIYDIRPSEKGFARIRKRILLNALVLPITRMENFGKLFDWYWIGQRTQFEALREHYGIDYPRFWSEILRPSILFILQWVGIHPRLHVTLIELYEDTLLLEREPFMNRWRSQLEQWRNDPDVRRYFSFFYQHGN